MDQADRGHDLPCRAHDIIANFTDEDTPLLEMLLLLDDVCTESGHTHYAVALAPRDGAERDS